MSAGADLYGVAARFAGGGELLAAVKAARTRGYTRIEAYSPMPVPGLAEELGGSAGRIAQLALAGGIVGGVGTYFLQWYSVSVAYPLNIGGRTPLWPGLVPGTFEMTILGAVLCVFFGMLFLNGLPRLRHPMFNVADFRLASSEGFFLCLLADDPRFDAAGARQFLQSQQPLQVSDASLEDTP